MHATYKFTAKVYGPNKDCEDHELIWAAFDQTGADQTTTDVGNNIHILTLSADFNFKTVTKGGSVLYEQGVRITERGPGYEEDRANQITGKITKEIIIHMNKIISASLTKKRQA